MTRLRRGHPIFRWLALLAFVSLGFQRQEAFAQSVSFTTNSYKMGGLGIYVAVADFNGDGKPDLITGSIAPVGGPTTVVAFTNNGGGVFGSNATLAVAIDLAGVVTGGVNGGGKPDLVFASDFANTLTVVTNNGSGVYGSNATYSVGNYPLRVTAADINGDGKVDLICGNETGRSVTVLTNSGGGMFGSNATYAVGNYPLSVVVADLNGDGKRHLVCANRNDNTLTVLTNNGSGSFGSNATFNVGPGPQCVVAVDVNGDGKLDLISANAGNYPSYGNTLTVLTNDGSGGFGSNATLNVGNNPVWVVAADVNGDGKPDLISANENDGTLTVLTNNGSGGFGSNATLNVGSQPMCVVAADFNGDGKMDLACADAGITATNGLVVLINTTPFPPPSLSITLGGGQAALSWPGWATNYVLESNADLSTTNWVAVTNGTPIVGGITLTNPWPAAFFRLRQF